MATPWVPEQNFVLAILSLEPPGPPSSRAQTCPRRVARRANAGRSLAGRTLQQRAVHRHRRLRAEPRRKARSFIPRSALLAPHLEGFGLAGPPPQRLRR